MDCLIGRGSSDDQPLRRLSTTLGGTRSWVAATNSLASTRSSGVKVLPECCLCTAPAASVRPRCSTNSGCGGDLPAGRQCPSTVATSTAPRLGSPPRSTASPDRVAPAADLLLLDGYERLGPIDSWVRSEFLPSLDAGMVVVLAGREPPSAAVAYRPGLAGGGDGSTARRARAPPRASNCWSGQGCDGQSRIGSRNWVGATR